MAAACVHSLSDVLSTNIFVSYEILSDANKREIYDMHGLEGMTGGQGDPMEMFAQFFAGGGGPGNPMFGFDFGPEMGGSRRGGKGQDSIIPYDVTLEDLYNGKSVKMNMEKEIICGICKGYAELIIPQIGALT